MNNLKKWGLVLLIVSYLVAGANHFHNPQSYLKIIPPYLPYHKLINIVAGLCEIIFALLLIFKKTRQFAAWGIIFMLIAFIPVHTKMVRDAPFLLGGSLLVTPFVAWIRLIVLQPLLILWAWWFTKPEQG